MHIILIEEIPLKLNPATLSDVSAWPQQWGGLSCLAVINFGGPFFFFFTFKATISRRTAQQIERLNLILLISVYKNLG